MDKKKMPDKDKIPVVSIFGIPVCKWAMQDVVSYLTEVVLSGQYHQVITANPIMLTEAQNNPEFETVMKNAELIIPDGTGLVWAAKMGGEPVEERVPGIELLHELMKQGEKHRWRVFLLGSAPEVVQEAANRLAMDYPLTHIVGVRDGYFTAEQDPEVIAEIKAANPHLLFVARGLDTQEPWIGKYKAELAVPIMMGVGGSFDVISGKTKRAPKFIQKMRMEWLYRALSDPARIPRLMAIPKFALRVMKEKDTITKEK